MPFPGKYLAEDKIAKGSGRYRWFRRGTFRKKSGELITKALLTYWCLRESGGVNIGTIIRVYMRSRWELV